MIKRRRDEVGDGGRKSRVKLGHMTSTRMLHGRDASRLVFNILIASKISIKHFTASLYGNRALIKSIFRTSRRKYLHFASLRQNKHGYLRPNRAEDPEIRRKAPRSRARVIKRTSQWDCIACLHATFRCNLARASRASQTSAG